MFLCIAVLGLVAAVDNAVYTSPAYACSIKEFTCGDGACVTWESRCDGVQHCADNSDEEGCWKDSNKFDLYDIVLHRNKRQSTCGKGDFHCRDGTCVSFDKKCDGVIDCPDGSDETHALCRNTRCPSNLFRCTYGACVDGNAACNQKEDCADKSDELLPKCRNEVQNVRGRFTCKNGDTISSFDHCDGVANCGDGSDETIESCAGIRCQTHLFQCAYGACVDSGANCNNKVQCVDGSDEADDLCNRTTTTTTSRPHTSFPSSTSCVLPDYPKHGSYEVVGIPVARPGMSYPSLHLTVTCDLGYGVEGSNFTFCHEGSGWSRTLPVCKKLCKLIPHPSVVYKCKVEGENRLEGERDCLAYEPNNTRVIPRCNPNYHHPGAIGNMRCIDGNNWDTTIICQPECGTPTADGMQLVVNGTQAGRGELPWHAGIYSKSYRPFMQICGGSLVTSTLVISAAHCFWKAGRLAPANRYAVALGKLYRPWDDPMDKDAQKFEISSIKLSEYYLDVATNYQNDIALIILSTTVTFTFYIRPICIDFDIKFDKRQLQPGNLGKVSGWGLTSQDGKPSPILLTTELPFVPVSQCIADVPVEFRAYITADKICAGTMNGTAVCQGDSGGGLAFPTVDDKGTQRYYLRGVVSTAPRNRTEEHACNVNSYTTFTHLQNHDAFVSEHINF